MATLKDQSFTPGHVLDVGCGSGILAIAAQKLWDCPVTAIDIDPEGEALTRRHITANGLKDEDFTVLTGDGYQDPQVQQHAPYDLVIANILAGPLVEMAAEAAKATGIYLLLSGLLESQEQDVINAHTEQQLTHDHSLLKEKGQNRWIAMIMKK
jgi:Ribosomal protein L11 methylase